MNIMTVILKSGIKIDLTDAQETKIIAREEIDLSYRGLMVAGETKWDPVPRKVVSNFLRVERDGSSWEIREDEIAAFQFKDEDKEIDKGDIKI